MLNDLAQDSNEDIKDYLINIYKCKKDIICIRSEITKVKSAKKIPIIKKLKIDGTILLNDPSIIKKKY